MTGGALARRTGAAGAARRAAAGLWRALGEVLGEGNYRRFAAHRAAAHPGEPVPSEREFWRETHERRERDPRGGGCC